MAPSRSFLQVSFFRRDEFLGSELFSESSILIGGSPSADLQLDDPGVAAKHALIFHENGKIIIKTLSNRHRTLVNDRAVARAVIDARDKIQVGGHELRVALVAPRSRPTAPAPIAELEDDEPETVAEITPVPRRPAVEVPVPPPVPARTPVPAVRARPASIDEDAEELEEEERPGYSLVEKLLADEGAAGDEEKVALEIVGFSDEQIQTTVLLTDAGSSFRLGARDPLGDRFRDLQLVRLAKRGEAILEIPVEVESGSLRRGKMIASKELEASRAVKSRGHTIRRMRLTAGAAVVRSGNAGYCVRFVPSRAVAGEKQQMAVDGTIRRAFGSALVMHVVIGALVGLGSSGFHYEEPKEQWAELAETDLRNVEIAEPPPPVEEKKPEPEVAEEEIAAEEPEKRPEKVPKKRKKPKTRTVAKTEEVKSKGILGALGKMSVQAPGRKSLVAAASNLNAVQVPGGGGFRVGALIAKAPASGISVGGGGGGKLLTRGTASLIRDGNLVAGIAKRSGSVRGKVGKASGRLLKAKGSISREEVARVINDHIREVQYCYEKTLISNAGLSGKLVIEWAIDQGGAVSKVRQKMSTLENPAVFDCISSKLRHWSFPKPQGGVVIVSYPFIFNSVGF
jgi:hypothetical protein